MTPNTVSEYIRTIRTAPNITQFLDSILAEPPKIMDNRQSVRLILTSLGEQFRQQLGGSGIASVIIEQQICHHGPKVVRLGQLNAEALENTLPTIEWADYRQPYPSMLIELPREYQGNKQTACPQSDEFDDVPERHHPTFCKLYHDAKQRMLIGSVVFSSGQSIEQMMWQKPETPTIEEGITDAALVKFDDASASTAAEFRITQDVIRLSVNACMLVTGNPKPDNDAHLQNLKRKERVAKERRHAARAKELRHQIRQHPMVYEIDQTIRLYDHSSEASDADHEAVGFKRPHWRRGHWRQQACGTAWLERRCVFVRPMLVNGKMFAGHSVDATATYVLNNQHEHEDTGV